MVRLGEKEEHSRKVEDKLRKRGTSGRHLDVSHIKSDGTGTRFIEYSEERARRKVPLGGPYPKVVSDNEEARELFVTLAGHTAAEKKAVREAHRKNARRLGKELQAVEIASPRSPVRRVRGDERQTPYASRVPCPYPWTTIPNPGDGSYKYECQPPGFGGGGYLP